MDSFIYAIHAASIMRARSHGDPAGRRSPEDFYGGTHEALKVLVRVTAALSGLALFAALLSFTAG